MSNYDYATEARRTARHARQRLALAVSHRADAESLKAERRADRRAKAARKARVAALRQLDWADA